VVNARWQQFRTLCRFFHLDNVCRRLHLGSTRRYGQSRPRAATRSKHKSGSPPLGPRSHSKFFMEDFYVHSALHFCREIILRKSQSSSWTACGRRRGWRKTVESSTRQDDCGLCDGRERRRTCASGSRATGRREDRLHENLADRYHLDLNRDGIGDFSVGFSSCEPEGTKAGRCARMRGFRTATMWAIASYVIGGTIWADLGF